MAEAKPKRPEGMRHLTEAEIAEMHGDVTPPEGYSNTTLLDAPAADAPPAGDPPAGDPPAGDPPAAPPAAGGDPPAAPPAAAPAADDSFARLERELAKPEGSEDLSKFSPREKAYFHQMRRDRKARQKAETERDTAAFTATKLKKELEQRGPAPAADPLSGMAEDDVLTVKEMRERLAKMPAPAAPEAPAAPPAASPRALSYLRMCENEARTANKDFDVVMELSDDLVSNSPEALTEISRRTNEGENPAQVMYEVIKKQKDFATLLPVAETRYAAKKTAAPAQPPAANSPAGTPSAPAATPTPEEQAKLNKAKQAETALEINGTKPKTTAHASSREGKPAEDLTVEDIASMTDVEFAKLPKAVRQGYLKKYGA